VIDFPKQNLEIEKKRQNFIYIVVQINLSTQR